jgi:shikimate dehydrogenase
MAKFGLIGKNISYSFSKAFFREKFKRESLPHTYENFDLDQISEFPKLLKQNPLLKGLNITIPYKESILPFLDAVAGEAQKIGAVNTIVFTADNRLIGYNTDYIGFQQSLLPHLPLPQKKALILGTGGASKAVAYALHLLEFDFQFVSRNPKENQLSYDQIDSQVVKDHFLIVNTTPLGTHPNTAQFPHIPYSALGSQHLLYDLVYNPAQTEFLGRGAEQGAKTLNGLPMLHMQAEAAWNLWNP